MTDHAYRIVVEVPITVESINARNRRWSHYARIAVALAVVRSIRGTIIIQTIIVIVFIIVCVIFLSWISFQRYLCRLLLLLSLVATATDNTACVVQGGKCDTQST